MADEKNLEKKIEQNFPEQEQAPDSSYEKNFETQEKESVPEEKKQEEVPDLSARPEDSDASPSEGQADDKEERKKQIEQVLEKDLGDLYLQMPQDKKAEFKKTGEETAKKINDLLDKAKVKFKEVVKLIRKWLSIIPGKNKYFLEQEAKIKADEILKIKDQHR